MDTAERRAEKRVRPPDGVVLDFALWTADLVPTPRLPLTVLGPPAACQRAGQVLTLSDVASIGIGAHLSGPPDILEALSAVQALYLYLKLREYRPLASETSLSLFFHAKIARAAHSPEGLALGLQVLHLGRGSSYEKSLEFLDVSRFGVKELAAWIDALRRAGLSEDTGVLSLGVDLDTLLDEPELNRESTQRTGE